MFDRTKSTRKRLKLLQDQICTILWDNKESFLSNFPRNMKQRRFVTMNRQQTHRIKEQGFICKSQKKNYI